MTTGCVADRARDLAGALRDRQLGRIGDRRLRREPAPRAARPNAPDPSAIFATPPARTRRGAHARSAARAARASAAIACGQARAKFGVRGWRHASAATAAGADAAARAILPRARVHSAYHRAALRALPRTRRAPLATMRYPTFTRAVALAAAVAIAGARSACRVAADAVTLRWAGRGDMQTTDPHSQNEGLTNNINRLVYEFLVDARQEAGLAPALAESWTQVNSDHVALQAASQRQVPRRHAVHRRRRGVQLRTREEPTRRSCAPTPTPRACRKKIDDLTVEFTTNGPNPIELEHVATINIMSKAWCEKHKCQKPQNFAGKEDMITAREANGTGPYSSCRASPTSRRAQEEPELVGHQGGQFDGNVDDVVYTPIVSDATRVAALISGEVDLINDPPPQDVPRLLADAEHQGDRRRGEPHRLHRHGPGARRAPVLERQGQEPVQGHARAARRSTRRSTSRRSTRTRCADCRSPPARSCRRR